MKLEDLIKEELSDDENTREIDNPIPFDKDKVYNAFNVADEVEGKLVDIYKKENNVEEFENLYDYSFVAKDQRKKYGVVMDVRVNQIIASEEKLYSGHIDSLKSGKDVKTSSEKPFVYKLGDDYIVGDGNHRIAAAVTQGAKTVNVSVLDLDKLKKQLNITDIE